MPEATGRSARTWQLWLALYVACSTVVGLFVSLLVMRSGVGSTDAVLAGGGGFATSFALCLALPAAVRELKQQNN
ncbi:hypothetical protein ABZ719_31675 [Streptomyces sp. NPDC006743]|uniref:hypothetical protein n=1 Tax=Streptomyces sp. NPDC006743 TaxID=3154480 RepID=UPI0034511E5D